METVHSSRIERARREMAASGLDALVISHLPNIFYLCGFSGSNAVLVFLHDSAHLFTDGRYTIQARSEAPDTRIHIGKTALPDAVGALLRSRMRKARPRIGFEAAHLSVAEWTRLKSAAGTRMRWNPVAGLIEGMRGVKSAGELDIMRQAAKLGSDVMTEAMSWVKPGITELELAARIDYSMREKGATGPAFDTIVASGVRSALPHAHPTEKRLRKNELVVIDLGAILRHYCSDLTRTVYLGRAPAKVRGWYRAVEQAQRAALQALGPDVLAGTVDRAARRVLESHHLGRYFVHSTGHGLGVEIHEAPRLGRRQTQQIKAGSIVTLEPGIYIEGVGGIRIEDEVAVHTTGAEVLTSAPHGLHEL